MKAIELITLLIILYISQTKWHGRGLIHRHKKVKSDHSYKFDVLGYHTIVKISADVCSNRKQVLVLVRCKDLSLRWEKAVTSNHLFTIPGFTFRVKRKILQIYLNIKVRYDEDNQKLMHKVELFANVMGDGEEIFRRMLTKDKEHGDIYDANKCRNSASRWWNKLNCGIKAVIITAAFVALMILILCPIMCCCQSNTKKCNKSNQTGNALRQSDSVSDNQPGDIH